MIVRSMKTREMSLLPKASETHRQPFLLRAKARFHQSG